MYDLIKYPILKKIRVGHRCKYIGKNNRYDDFGFIPGKYYYVVDRLPRIIAFSTNKFQSGIDFGLNDGGDYFLENWEIDDEERITSLPDFDMDNEKNYIYADMIRLNSES